MFKLIFLLTMIFSVQTYAKNLKEFAGEYTLIYDKSGNCPLQLYITLFGTYDILSIESSNDYSGVIDLNYNTYFDNRSNITVKAAYSPSIDTIFREKITKDYFHGEQTIDKLQLHLSSDDKNATILSVIHLLKKNNTQFICDFRKVDY